MKKIPPLFACCLVLSLLLSSCGLLTSPAPTVTPTPLPSQTTTATATASTTLTPMPTFTPLPPVVLDKAIVARKGGFSFQPPAGYSVFLRDPIATLSNENDSIEFTLFGGSENVNQLTAEEILNDLVSIYFSNGSGEYSMGEPEQVPLAEMESLAKSLSGTYLDSPFSGKAIVLMAGPKNFIFMLGLAFEDDNSNLWESDGSRVMDAMFETIAFVTVEPTGGCVISTDNTYGYTPENAIRVGGDWLEGPSRERAFLDNLLGPNGEEISYTRRNSFDFGDTILDIYDVAVAGKNVVLYFDEYAYTEPQAPVGFTCFGPFPLEKP